MPPPLRNQLGEQSVVVRYLDLQGDSPESPLRRLFAYKCAYELKWEQGFKSDAHELPVELISEVASVYQRDALKCKKGHNCGHDSPAWGNSHCNRCNNIIDPNDYYIKNTARSKGW
jgi:hypothetical protein